MSNHEDGPPPPRPARKATRKAAPGKAATREERLKAALRANMARRKAQARARKAAAPPATETD